MTEIPHRHGGVIERVTAIEHSTSKGVADWEFRGRVRWDDGSVSESAHISPVCLCHITPGQKAEVERLMKALNKYLVDNGKWHELKRTRDGRVYSWTPHTRSGKQTL